MTRPTKEFAIGRLQKQLDAIPDLKTVDISSTQFIQWKRDTRVAVSHVFGEGSSQVQELDRIRYTPIAVTIGSYSLEERQMREGFVGGISTTTATLRSMINEIQEYWPDDTQAQGTAKGLETLQPVLSRRVFVIHGSDHGTRDTVARFLEDLDLEPVILEEQPDGGLTVIEKFEENASGAFVVALLTPDDVGGSSQSELRPRARQNVILELGYFLAKFGRDKVRALLQGDVEIPSDLAGVLYIQLDVHGGWKTRLIREMSNAGLNIDANLAV